MITEANIKDLLTKFKKDMAEDTTSFIKESLLMIQSAYPFVTSGYVALVDDDIWFIHSYVGTKFTALIDLYKDQLLQKRQYYVSGIPLANNIDIIFPAGNTEQKPYITDTISEFYRQFDEIIQNTLIKCHKSSTHHIIIPFYLDNRLLGHMVLGIMNHTSLNLLTQALKSMDNLVSILSVCIFTMGKERHTEDSNYIISTTLAIANTALLTGCIHKSFMSNLLKASMHLIPESDYGSSIIISNEFWIFDDAIGHDSEALRKTPITKAIFQENMSKSSTGYEIEKDVFIIDHILSFSQDAVSKANEILQRITEASKPIKSSMQVHIKSRGQLQGIISLDISPDSPLQFSKKSAKLLKQIGQVASMFFNYNTLYGYTESFGKLTELIATVISATNDNDTQFLRNFLRLVVNSITEANYATILLRTKGKVHYIDAIGHNIDSLRKLDIDEKYLQDHTLATKSDDHMIPMTIYQNVYDQTASKMPKALRTAYLNAVKPVQESIVCHYRLDSHTIIDLSIDISKNSFMNFSTESIRIFKAFSNIGFAFITNQFFTKEITNFIGVIDDHNKIVGDLINQNNNLKKQIKLDELTNLYNHTYIVNLLDKEIMTSSESRKPLSIVLFDIDNFKSVNDIFGHSVGDLVLESIALIIKTYHDISYAGRYGGEEFLVILPESDSDQAFSFAENLRKQIADTLFDHNLEITISAGVATWTNESVSELIQQADGLLHQAKEKGRNLICR